MDVHACACLKRAAGQRKLLLLAAHAMSVLRICIRRHAMVFRLRARFCSRLVFGYIAIFFLHFQSGQSCDSAVGTSPMGSGEQGSRAISLPRHRAATFCFAYCGRGLVIYVGTAIADVCAE